MPEQMEVTEATIAEAASRAQSLICRGDFILLRQAIDDLADQATRAVLHDRKPYPTSEAYERMRAALQEAQDEVVARQAQITAMQVQYGQIRAHLDQALEIAVEAIVDNRPQLPFRSTAAMGEMDMEVRVVGDRVVIRGCSHTPRSALDLSAAIAHAALEAAPKRRGVQP